MSTATGSFQRSPIGDITYKILSLRSLVILIFFALAVLRDADMVGVLYVTIYAIRCVVFAMLVCIPVESCLVRLLPGLSTCLLVLLYLLAKDPLIHMPHKASQHARAFDFLLQIVITELLSLGFWLPSRSALGWWTMPFYWRADEEVFPDGPTTISEAECATKP